MSKTFPLYNFQGHPSLFYLKVMSKNQYYIVKLVEDQQSYFSDKTTYREIVIQKVEDPFDITVFLTRLYIDSKDISDLELEIELEK